MGTGKDKSLTTAAELRRHAEERLLSKSVESPPMRTEEQTQRLVHELEVHQIELEMQCEELCRTQAEQEVLRARYFDLYDLAPVGYVTLGKTGLILEANLTVATLLGVARSKLHRRLFRSFILPEDQKWFSLHHQQLLATDEPQTCEVRLITSAQGNGAGNIVPVLLSCRIHDLFDSREISVTVTDLTQQKRNEELMATERLALTVVRERDLLQAVMNGAKNSHLVYLDRDFTFVQVNETYAASCGYRPEEMIGKNLFNLYPDSENEAIFARVRDTGEGVTCHDKPFVFPDQPERGVTWWDWTLSPVKESSGLVTGLVFSLVDTTERKLLEEKLRRAKEGLEQQVAERTRELQESESKYRIIFNNEIYAICLFDLESGKLLDVNEAQVKLYGYRREELLSGMSDYDLSAERERSKDSVQSSANSSSTFIPLRYHRKKDGTVFPVEIVAGPCQWINRQVMFALVHDISDRKQADQWTSMSDW